MKKVAECIWDKHSPNAKLRLRLGTKLALFCLRAIAQPTCPGFITIKTADSSLSNLKGDLRCSEGRKEAWYGKEHSGKQTAPCLCSLQWCRHDRERTMQNNATKTVPPLQVKVWLTAADCAQCLFEGHPKSATSNSLRTESHIAGQKKRPESVLLGGSRGFQNWSSERPSISTRIYKKSITFPDSIGGILKGLKNLFQRPERRCSHPFSAIMSSTAISVTIFQPDHHIRSLYITYFRTADRLPTQVAFCPTKQPRRLPPQCERKTLLNKIHSIYPTHS